MIVSLGDVQLKYSYAPTSLASHRLDAAKASGIVASDSSFTTEYIALSAFCTLLPH